MFLNKKFLTAMISSVFVLIFPLIVAISFPVSAQSQPYILEVKIGDLALVGIHTDVHIPVYLKNLTDSIGAFDFQLVNDRPDLVSLKDTIIRNGCLTENWEMLNSYFIGESSDTLRLFGMADWISIPFEEPAIYFPQYGEIPLFYILADITQESDSTNAQATLSFLLDQPTDFIVSDEIGYTVGTRQVDLVDTVYYACEVWYAGECLSWVEVDGPPADSIEYWAYHETWVDSTLTNISSGQIDIGWHLCGDLAGGDDLVDLADITAMISFVYSGGPPPAIPWSANVNGSLDGLIDLADITRLISHVYLGGEPLDCPAP